MLVNTGHHSKASDKATSKIIYLNRDDVLFTPGDNDSSNGVSSIVQQPTVVPGWATDDDTWAATVACVQNMYARFDVQIVTDAPADNVPHILAHFGGSPTDVGLPDNVAGVSPFTTDCSNIDNSIVFMFTDVLEDDSQVMCEIMSQEIAHSYGLDHQMLAEDPMTYLDYAGDRSFQDQMATCGEFESRPCGIDGSVCRNGQDSVSVLTNRLGLRGAESGSGDLTTTTEPEASGCSASGSGAPLAGLAVVLFGLRRRKRRR